MCAGPQPKAPGRRRSPPPAPFPVSHETMPRSASLRGQFLFCPPPSSFVSVPRRSCLPLSREVADPEGLPEGEIRRAYAKRDAQSRLIANSLPQSPAATAPSSEGAKGGWAMPADRPLRGSQALRGGDEGSPSEGAKGLGCAFRPPSPHREKAKPRGRRGAGVLQKPSSAWANGGSGGHFAFGTKAPRRPFCPLSAGGKWTNAPPRKRGGGPGRFDRLSRRTQRLPAA
mgnify:CR=1 FL=1